MHPKVVSRLLQLNQEFYQTFALQFSSTRQRLQPGVRKVIGMLNPIFNILDLGCGNGEFAVGLARSNHQGIYLGIDNNLAFLTEAQRKNPKHHNINCLQVDLAKSDWSETVQEWAKSRSLSTFDVVVAFAVLHHLPGYELRKQVMQNVHLLLKPGGTFIHSEWQYLNSLRLRSRIQPWEKIGVSNSDVKSGDNLLDWRAGSNGLRYVHHFSIDELNILAKETGFIILETFLSDGEQGKLGLYQTWQSSQ